MVNLVPCKDVNTCIVDDVNDNSVACIQNNSINDDSIFMRAVNKYLNENNSKSSKCHVQKSKSHNNRTKKSKLNKHHRKKGN